MFLLSLLFWAAVVAGALALLGYLNRRYLRAETSPDAIHFVTTEDGWRLSLTHHHPRAPLPGAPPVVLCAGAGFGSVVFDVTRETSLARYLAEHGHDVWLLDLRGRGRSPGRRAAWSFDDYVEFDLPAAVGLVLDRSGAEQVQWIGFGVGALVASAALSAGALSARLRSVVSLAAPVFFRRQQATFRPRLLRSLRLLRIDLLSALVAPLLGRLFPGPLKLLQNRDNVDGAVYRRALVNGLARLSRTELNQYAEWLEHDTFTAMVQRRDYRAAMADITTPTLFIVGPRDELAPVEMVEATASLLDSVDDRVLVVASRMHGMSTNYGHLDLLLGRGVQRDIHTHVLRWLDLHAGVEIPEGRPEPPEPREGWEEPPRRDRTGRGDAARSDDTPRALPSPEDEQAATAPASPADGADPEPDDDESEEDLVQGDVPRLPG